MPQLRFMLAIALFFTLPVWAAVDVREFSSDELRQRYQTLVAELRCPKCENQNLAGSNSPIAMDLRRELHRMLEEGASDSEIKAFMVARYGDYVLYRPPVRDNTLILWWGPPGFLVLGVLVVLLIAWRRRRLMQVAQSNELTEEDRLRLESLLAAQENPRTQQESTDTDEGGR